MADYNIEITEEQTEYEYLLNIRSFKLTEGAKSPLRWHVSQADPNVFAYVDICPNGSNCVDVIQDAGADFSGEINAFLLKFAFVPGAPNGTFNIFLEQEESLLLLNIEVLRNVSFFEMPSLGISSATMQTGDEFFVNSTECEPVTTYPLTTFNYECHTQTTWTSAVNFLITPDNRPVIGTGTDGLINAPTLFVWLANIFNVRTYNSCHLEFNKIGGIYSPKTCKITNNNIVTPSINLSNTLVDNILTISNIDLLKCKCDYYSKINGLYSLFARMHIYAIEIQNIQNRMSFDCALANRYGDVVNFPKEEITNKNIYNLLKNLEVNEAPILTHETIDINTIEQILTRPFRISFSFVFANQPTTSIEILRFE